MESNGVLRSPCRWTRCGCSGRDRQRALRFAANYPNDYDIRQRAGVAGGVGPVRLTIRASDEAGGLGSSATFDVEFAAWNPDGTRFAAIYGDVDNENQRDRVHFHDGNTGLRLNESIDLPFEPSHLEWSPDGQMLAMSRVGIHQTSQRPFNCGLEVMRKQGNSFGAPETVIPIEPGVNHFNPNFAPDSSFMVFSRSVCPNGDDENDECDGDSDLYAQTYAVQPQPGATPVFLARGGGPGVEDQGNKNLSDTFPRFSPFAKRQGAGRLVWVTVSSRRRFGLRDNGRRQLLWMFAIDRDRDAGRPGRELSGVLRALSGLWYVESHRAVDGRGDAVHSVAGSASTDGGLWRGRALTRQGFA